MQYKSVKGYTGFGQLGLLLVCIGAGLILTTIVQTVIAFQIVPKGTGFAEMAKALPEAMKDPKNLNLSRLLQVIGTFTMLCIPAVLFSWISNGRNAFWLGFNRHINVFQVLIGFLIIFTANIITIPLDGLIRGWVAHFPSLDSLAKELEQTYNEQVLLMSNLTSWPEFLMALLVIAFFPALFEELFFRGALQNFLAKWWKRPILAIIVVSLLFSLIHVSVYLFIGRAMLGFVLGYMYFKTRNIWVNIIAHFLNNALALAQLFSMNLEKQKGNTKALNPNDISSIDPKVEWWVGLLALVILVFLFRMLVRYSARNQMKIHTREHLLLSSQQSDQLLASKN